MIDVTQLPYADWLEETLKDMVGLIPRAIGIVCLTEDGISATAYWRADKSDMQRMAATIQDDATVELIRVNAELFRSLLEDEDEDDDDDENDEATRS